jgi:xanthine/CO dehydrogenase XdhC/CoxF family maturation factor
VTAEQTVESATDPACALAHDDQPSDDLGTLVAVFASPVARWLLHFGRHIGFRTVLIEPRPEADDAVGPYADRVYGDVAAANLDDTADVVITDHHRTELGELVRDALATPARWIGVMGSPRHIPPHIERLRELGTSEEDIARVHRPIGLNIGSKTPPEIAVATLAGLIADRRERPGGFEFLS